jgi:hypothetical protein
MKKGEELMKPNPQVRRQAARHQSIDRTRRTLQRSFAEARQDTPQQAAARKRLEAHEVFEPLLRLIAAAPLPPRFWRDAVALTNEAIESLATGAARDTSPFTPDGIGLTAETPGATPDFRAGRDL